MTIQVVNASVNAAFTSFQHRKSATLAICGDMAAWGPLLGDVLSAEAPRRSRTQDQVLALTGKIEPSKLIKSSVYIVHIHALQQILIL